MCVFKNIDYISRGKITMKKSTDKPVEEAVVEEAPSISTPNVEPVTQAPADVNLSIQDLTTALQIISVVTARGAIKAEEMAVCGALYNKLKLFLEAAAVAAEQAEAAKAAEEVEVEPKASKAKK